MTGGIAARLRACNPWRRRAIAISAGATGALALAPFGLFPALMIAMTLAVWLIDAVALSRNPAHRARAAAAIGWWFGFGYFVAGLWWLGVAFLVDADEFAWALPLGVLGLPAALALFTAGGFGLAGVLWSGGPLRILALAGALGLADYLRGTLFTGFPWNAFGMALGEHLLTAQIASIVGVYGLSILAVAISAAPATLDRRSAGQTAAPAHEGTAGRWLRRLAPTGFALAVLAGIFGYGWDRIPTSSAPSVENVRIRLVQPAIPQDNKVFNWENRAKILNNYISLSEGGGDPESLANAGITHLIWPESALPFLLADSPDALSAIGRMLPADAFLITGAARGEALTPGARPSRFYNSMQVIDHGGRIVGVYDKSQLVPFGEYLPFAAFLDRLGLRQFVQMPGGFTAGAAGGGLNAPGLPPVTPLICYEAIFPGFGSANAGRGVILNVTNDGWFGETPGPWQHFSQARLRAIEQGLPLIRAANTGISAVVDSFGRTNTLLPLGQIGFTDSALPMALAPTIYAQMGNLFFAVLLVFCLCCCALGRLRLRGRTCRRELVYDANGVSK